MLSVRERASRDQEVQAAATGLVAGTVENRDVTVAVDELEVAVEGTAGGPFNGDFELIDSDGDVAILDSTGNQAGGGGLDFLIA